MARRLRPRSEPARRLIRAGLIALALLALGEAAPYAYPVGVSIEAHGAELQVTVDGQTHTLTSALGGAWRSVVVEQPGLLEREYQIDGSDTTSTDDRQVPLILGLQGSALYAFDAWLRDEGSYSRWERVRIADLRSGLAVPVDGPLPNEFRLEAALRRPEAPARLWLVGTDGREGLELDRDRRNARWLIQRGGATQALPRWFFPDEPAPFAAELLHLLGRAAAAAFGLVLLTVVVRSTFRVTAAARLRAGSQIRGVFDPPVTPLFLGAWLIAAALVTTRLYHQLPHILDAVSYTFQAGLFASGQLALKEPPLALAFKGPFEVLWQGRLFSQYPPGAPAAYALGRLLSLEWLVGPLACLAMLAATAWTARTLFGPFCGITALALGVISPFVLFQSGSYLSHPIAGGLLGLALACFVRAERRGPSHWYAASAALLGAGFLAREAASVLFAIPLGVRLLTGKRWRPSFIMVASGLPFVLVYLGYNAALTGSPFTLPRSLFDAADHFGFGDGIGFHTRHTLAAGLANTDELLTILQFDLFGWPPLFALGLVGLVFLAGRPRTWDWLAALGFLSFVAAYVGYFYHGIALGPRYYFEAMPWLLLLAARGAQALARAGRSRVAALAVLALVSINTVAFYLPAELQRRADLSGLPGGVRVQLAFVQNSLFGPRLSGSVPPNALVVTDDWWLFNTSLAALNCSRLPACGVLFALITSRDDLNALRAQYPGRTLLRAVDDAGRVALVPLQP